MWPLVHRFIDLILEQKNASGPSTGLIGILYISVIIIDIIIITIISLFKFGAGIYRRSELVFLSLGES